MLKGLLCVPSPGDSVIDPVDGRTGDNVDPTSSGIPSAAVIRDVCAWGVIVGVPVKGDFDISLGSAGCREGSGEEEAKADGGLHDP